VAAYKGRTQVYRVQPAGLGILARQYGRVGALILFPPFTKADIRSVAGLPVKLPAGISRHIIHNRALRVNLDLALLREARPAAEKQAQVDAMIRTRILEHRVRFYPESTVLFDE
jgi:hypothetical protein